MEYQREKLKDHTMLTFSGELTIAHADHLRSTLKETLDKADHVVLDVKQVTQMDLSALQLFCSAHRTAVADGKQIRFGCPAQGAIGQTLSLSGFVREIGCDRKVDHNCLWSGGES